MAAGCPATYVRASLENCRLYRRRLARYASRITAAAAESSRPRFLLARTPASFNLAAASTVDKRSSQVDTCVAVTFFSSSQNSSVLRACGPRRPSIPRGRPITMTATSHSSAAAAIADASAGPPTRDSASKGVTTVPVGSETARPMRASPRSTASVRPPRSSISDLPPNRPLLRLFRGPRQTRHQVWTGHVRPPGQGAVLLHLRHP